MYSTINIKYNEDNNNDILRYSELFNLFNDSNKIVHNYLFKAFHGYITINPEVDAILTPIFCKSFPKKRLTKTSSREILHDFQYTIRVIIGHPVIVSAICLTMDNDNTDTELPMLEIIDIPNALTIEV
jgi:hypothetical protein